MVFIYLPSLQHLTLFEVAVTLWNKYGSHFDTVNKFEKNWNSVKNEVSERIENLLLNTVTRERLVIFYKAIYYEIALWLEFNRRSVPSQYNSICIRDIKWTAVGTIDKKRTAERLVKNEKLPITVRYELACIYCIQDYVKRLYELLPKNNNYQHFFFDDTEYGLFGPDVVYDHDKLIVAWTHEMRNGGVNSNCVYLYAVSHGNKVAAESLFFGKKVNLVRLVLVLINNIWFEGFWRTAFFIEVLCLLLSQMDVDELTSVLHSEETHVLCTVLFCLKHWPWSYCLKESCNCTCGLYCNESNCLTLLNLFYKPRKEGNKTIFLWTLFSFQNAFPEKISSLIRNCNHKNLLEHIVQANDVKSLELALKHLPEMKTINYFKKGCKKFCEYMTGINDFRMLEVIRKELTGPKWRIITENEIEMEKLRNDLLKMFQNFT